MLPEPPRSTTATSPPPPRFKYRIRFCKAGDLRLVSHHDLMHCFERMFRRASLPVPRTQGFNPRPRMWFALSLALGVIGRREVLELELTEPLSADEVHQRLAAQAPPGITILSAQTIDVRAGARVSRADYFLPLSPAPVDLAGRCSAFLELAHHWVERERPHRRRLDVRPYVSELLATPAGLRMALWITPYGAARPEEVALALELGPCLEDGAVFERTDLELEDEQSSPPPRPLLAPARPVQRARETAAAQPTALVDGPLSFES